MKCGVHGEQSVGYMVSKVWDTQQLQEGESIRISTSWMPVPQIRRREWKPFNLLVLLGQLQAGRPPLEESGRSSNSSKQTKHTSHLVSNLNWHGSVGNNTDCIVRVNSDRLCCLAPYFTTAISYTVSAWCTQTMDTAENSAALPFPFLLTSI